MEGFIGAQGYLVSWEGSGLNLLCDSVVHTPCCPSSPPTFYPQIPVVRQKLYRASELLQSLRSLYTQLVSVQSSDGDRWSLTMEEVARAKVGRLWR